jgi:hypothetical protein
MKLSRQTAHRLALHYAIAERDGFAGATAGCGDGVSEKASALANEFRRVLREEFGEVTVDDAIEAANLPTVSIFDIPALQAEQGAK